MITRIELTNFMSHQSTVIEPAPGLTVLVGPNNCGKSAVVAALQILCNNADSTYVTRHGAKQCSVLVETDDGHRIEWRRKTSASYRINGEKFDRLGRGKAPEQLLNVLRLPRVEVGDDNLFDVHFGEQKSPIFLLDKPASHIAKFFASSSDVDRFLKMQDLHRTKVADANREKQHLELESVTLNRELGLLEPVVELEERLVQSELHYRELQRLAQTIDELTRRFKELRRQSIAVKRCAARQASLDDLCPPPAFEDSEPLAALITELDQVRRDFRFTSEQVTALGDLQPPPELPSTELLASLAGGLLAAQRAFAQTQGRSVALSPLGEPPRLDDADSLARLRQELADMQRFVERRGAQGTLLASVRLPPQLLDDTALETTLRHLMQASEQCAFVSRGATLLGKISPPPLVEDVAPAFELLRSLEDAGACVARRRSALEHLAAVDAVPAQENPSELAELVHRLSLGADEVRKYGDQAAQAQADFLAAKESLIRWARDYGICPTCGGPMNAERLVTHLSCQGDAANA
jgi:exonuclease SbcC